MAEIDFTLKKQRDRLGQNFENPRLDTLYNALFGYVGPPFPLVNALDVRSNAQQLGRQLKNRGRIPFLPVFKDRKGIEIVDHVSLSLPGGESYTFPIPPIMSITSQNHIVRRSALRQKGGTVKELWSQNDHLVVLRGVFISGYSSADPEELEQTERYPEEDVRQLQQFFSHDSTVKIASPIAKAFDIEALAIESIRFPHTAGLRNQAYEIRGYSDAEDYELLENL